jgi:hypothetical protein
MDTRRQRKARLSLSLCAPVSNSCHAPFVCQRPLPCPLWRNREEGGRGARGGGKRHAQDQSRLHLPARAASRARLRRRPSFRRQTRALPLHVPPPTPTPTPASLELAMHCARCGGAEANCCCCCCCLPLLRPRRWRRAPCCASTWVGCAREALLAARPRPTLRCPVLSSLEGKRFNERRGVTDAPRRRRAA